MNEDNLSKMCSSMCSLSIKFFNVLKNEYSIYLSKKKKEFLDKINISKFYKIINDANLPNIFFIGETYYLNSYYCLDNIEQLVPFLCLSSLVNNLNPLKIGLIENELMYLNDKYNLNININYQSEFEIASIVSKSILSNIPFKVIFKDSDSDIVSYLQEEENSDIGLCYYNISKQMKKIKSSNNYFGFNNNVDYSSVIDYIYDFIGMKIR